MTRALLDVNVLIALVDVDHVAHDRVHDWASAELTEGWATCALTENGFVRILSQPAYPADISIADALGLLRTARGGVGHEFWSCDVSLTEPTVIDAHALLGHRQVTDAYLLALAVRNDGRFVTLDRSVPLDAVPGATARHLRVIH